MTAAPADDLLTEYTEEDRKFDFVAHFAGPTRCVLGPYSTKRAARYFAAERVEELVKQGADPAAVSYRVDPVPQAPAPAAPAVKNQQAFHLPPEPPVGSTVRHDVPVDDGVRYTRGRDGWRSNSADWTIGEIWAAILFLAARDARAALCLVTDEASDPAADPLATVRARPGGAPVLVIRSDGADVRPWRVFGGVRTGEQARYRHDEVADWPVQPLHEVAKRLGHPAAQTAAP